MRTSEVGWKIVAVAQALIWFFVLPPLIKPHWLSIWSSLSPLQRQMALNQVPFFYYCSYSLAMLPIYSGNHSFFEQYKISDKPWAWRSEDQKTRSDFWALSRKSVVLFLVNFWILIPVITAAKFAMFGDNMSFSIADWPSYRTLALHNVALTLIHEFCFYWAHRLSHHPWLYKFHKIHHEYKQNTVLASQHEHPIDYVITIATPVFIAVLMVDPHSFTIFQWIAWLIVANIDDHLGYQFPWSPVRWFWTAARTDQHEFHHSHNMGCFASKLAIWDMCFDSERPYLN